MPPKKKVPPPAFLKTAAEAIGTALGKLAVKTGVAAPAAAAKRPKASTARKASSKVKAAKVRTRKPAKKTLAKRIP
jgi:hypothetical protein